MASLTSLQNDKLWRFRQLLAGEEDQELLKQLRNEVFNHLKLLQILPVPEQYADDKLCINCGVRYKAATSAKSTIKEDYKITLNGDVFDIVPTKTLMWTVETWKTSLEAPIVNPKHTNAIGKRVYKWHLVLIKKPGALVKKLCPAIVDKRNKITAGLRYENEQGVLVSGLFHWSRIKFIAQTYNFNVGKN